ncbi:putative uncharacterized protein [Bacteroides pectinophilus CAG:437]|uniref:histidine kinase n=1 Tax=Bacteroides pectinophilus CAG:437 TaxID=1263051 RepID=R7B2C8_9FIRM|nr:putative uncharacterized protein [Bacteroides pectinophilus CAG:437]
MKGDRKSKKLGSTARNLHIMWIVKLVGRIAGFNIIFAVTLVVLSAIYMNRTAWGRWLPEAMYVYAPVGVPAVTRNVSYDKQQYTFVYEERLNRDAGAAYNMPADGYLLRINLRDRTAEYELYSGNLTKTTDITFVARMFIWMWTVLNIWQLIGLAVYAVTGIRPIRKRLKPLNEISEDAFKISTMPFDETRIHDLENAISRITPDGPQGKLVTNDSELKGLEAAINSMIDRLRDSYRQQVRFVSDASHELRTPIAVIKGYADMLDRWGKDDPKILEESITAIRKESSHMNELVEQLLFLARGDSGRQPVNIEHISINEVMKEVYEESLMIDGNHTYEFKSSGNIEADADEAMLKQAVRILVDNAAKYTDKGDGITLGCGYNDDGRPMLYVQDNGIGMSSEDVKHVFERFYRADNARYSKAQGSGLGLSIAKWIIDRHGGYFDVLSRKDIGTRITVILRG